MAVQYRRSISVPTEKGKTMREKLIELIKRARSDFWLDRFNSDYYGFVADHLITNGVTIQQWIPVTERLPDEDGKYLVFEKSGGRTNTSILRFAKDARKVDKYDFKGRWKNAWYEYDSEWGHYTVGSVTHWMPLPEPPKEE